MSNRKRKFVMKRLDNLSKKDVKKHWDETNNRAKKIIEELTPGDKVDPEYIQFPELDIHGHNMAVDITADGWEMVDGISNLLKLKKHLKDLVYRIYGKEHIAEKIKKAVEEKQSLQPHK